MRAKVLHEILHPSLLQLIADFCEYFSCQCIHCRVTVHKTKHDVCSRPQSCCKAAVDLLSRKPPSRTLSRAGLSRFGSKPSPAVESTAENGLSYSNSLHSKAIFCQFIKIKVVVCQLNHFSAVLGFSWIQDGRRWLRTRRTWLHSSTTTMMSWWNNLFHHDIMLSVDEYYTSSSSRPVLLGIVDL